MKFVVIILAIVLLLVAVMRYRAVKVSNDLNRDNAATQKTIQDAIDELGRVAEDDSVSASELQRSGDITISIIESYNLDGGLDPLIADTKSWLDDKLKERN